MPKLVGFMFMQFLHSIFVRLFNMLMLLEIIQQFFIPELLNQKRTDPSVCLDGNREVYIHVKGTCKCHQYLNNLS